MPAALATGREVEIKPRNTASGARGGTAPPDAAVTKSFIPALSVANNVNLLVESLSEAVNPALVIIAL